MDTLAAGAVRIFVHGGVPPDLGRGGLNQKFDAIIFSDGAISAPGRDSLSGASLASRQPKPETIPAEFRPWLGSITPEKTMPQLQKFVENGGTVLAIGSSTSIYQYFHLPLQLAAMEVVKGKAAPVSPEKFYIPGSLMRTQVNVLSPVAYRMPEKVDVFFDRSPAFRAEPDATQKGLQTIAW